MAKRLALLCVTLALSAPAASSPAAPPDGSPSRDASAIGPAVFPHDEHVEDFEIECDVCHHETSAAPLSTPHAEYFQDFWIDCGICHHTPSSAPRESQSCSACHHSANGDIADETLSAKVVIHRNCWECHEVGTGADASATCMDCHTE